MRSADAQGTWLCPTPFDRSRLLDMEARLATARTLMYAAMVVAFLVCAPLLGWWSLAPVAFCVVAFGLLQPRIATADRPEYVVATMLVVAQVQIGMGIALTGGPQSPVLVLLLLPIVTLPARFGTRGVRAGVALTVAVLLASTLGANLGVFREHPAPVIVAVAVLFALAAFSDALMRAEVESRSESAQDALTGLLNRKALATHAAEIARQAELTGRSVCLVLLDLDRFKAVNDEHGHAAGDTVLVSAGQVLRDHLRAFELVYRVGGEEFLVLLPGVDRQGGRVVAERLREALETARPGGLAVTASFGVAVAHGAGAGFDALFAMADEALYAAKHAGRNRVVVAPDLRPDAAALPAGAPARTSATPAPGTG